MRWQAAWLALAVVVAGCGGGEPETTAERTPEPRAAEPAETPAAASSDVECAELWNANARPGSAGQKSPTDYLIELAAERPARVLVLFENGECLVFAPLPGSRREAYVFVARGGRAPFGHPSRIDIDRGRTLRHNARATAEGRIELE